MDQVYCVNDTQSDQRDNAGETTNVPWPNTTPEPLQDTAMDASEATRVTIKEGNVIQYQGSADVSDVCEKPLSKGEEVSANGITNGSTVEVGLTSDASGSQGIDTPPEQTEDTDLPTTLITEEKAKGDNTPTAADISNTPEVDTPAGDTTSMAEGTAPLTLSSDQSTSQVSHDTEVKMSTILYSLLMFWCLPSLLRPPI